jgi:simple sugar transport system permease protein
MNREKTFQIIRTCVAMLVAVLVAFLIILAVSSNPIESIKIFLLKPFSSLRYVGNILETATPADFFRACYGCAFQNQPF